MATPFCLSMGYNFGCVIASDTLLDSRGWVFGVKLSDKDIADFEVLRDVAMATIFGFIYMGCTLATPDKNTTEPSMCGGDAALCQITLTTCSNSASRSRSCHDRARVVFRSAFCTVKYLNDPIASAVRNVSISPPFVAQEQLQTELTLGQWVTGQMGQQT